MFRYPIKVRYIYRQMMTVAQIVSRRQVATEVVPRLVVRQPVTEVADAVEACAVAMPANSARPLLPQELQVVTEFKRIDRFSRYINPFSLKRDEDVDTSSLSLLNTI